MRLIFLTEHTLIILKHMKKEIQTRTDVYQLVDCFYKKVRRDTLLGPIFNQAIDDWLKHLQRLTDFWETNLFFVSKFKGDPILKHQQVDAQNNYSINSMHFGVWLNLWFETLEEHFEGEKMNLAKDRARNMGTLFYLKMFVVRPQIK